MTGVITKLKLSLHKQLVVKKWETGLTENEEKLLKILDEFIYKGKII